MTPLLRQLEFPAAASARAAEAFEIRDDSTGLLAYLALIPGQVDPAFGGIRRRYFEAEEAALNEAAKLALQMREKIAFAELPQGAAKTVIVDRDDLDLEAVYRSLGQAIDSLRGRYFSGPDVGTGEAQLAWLAEETSYVNHAENNPGPSTALGVAAGLDAAVAHKGWARGVEGKRVLIQGLGSVGSSLAAMLKEKGAQLLLCDLDQARAQHVAEQITAAGGAARVVGAMELEEVAADIFCPCALGDVVNSGSDRFEVICGSANLQLSDLRLADELFQKGTLFVPEAAVNAGAVIEGILVQAEEDEERGRQLAQEHILATRGRVQKLLQMSAEYGLSPSQCLLQMLKESP